jgi:hypothetical protein
MVNEKEKELIRQAWDTSYTRWSEIDKLIDQAESEETKSTLKDIQVYKYHQEEALADLL